MNSPGKAERGGNAAGSEPLRALVISADLKLCEELTAFLDERGVKVRILGRLQEIPAHCEPHPAAVLVDLASERPDPWHRAHRVVRHCQAIGTPVLLFNSRPFAVSGEGAAPNGFDHELLHSDVLRLLGLTDSEKPAEPAEPAREGSDGARLATSSAPPS